MDQPTKQQLEELHRKILELDSKEKELEKQATDELAPLMGSGSDTGEMNDDMEHFEIHLSSTPKNVIAPCSPLAQKASKPMKQPNFVEGLKTCEIYHGVLPEDEVDLLLVKNGDYLLASKYSETKKNVVCFVRWQNQIRLLEFTQALENPEVTLDRINYKPTILELVNYYQNSNIPIGNNGACLLRSVRRQSWELDPKNLTIGRLLGEGAFGQVFFATLKQNGKVIPVAVKKPRVKSNQGQEILKKAMDEARIQRAYTHHNIVRLFGVVFDQNQCCIVLEYLDGGALDAFLKTSPLCTPNLQTAFCFDIAVGMEYLHYNNCLHRDMAARNCLVHLKYLCAKISDFGLSAKGKFHQMDRAKPTPIRWMAPEVLKTATYGKPSDIWSMAILFWEISKKCKDLPYPDKDLKQVQALLFSDSKFHPDIDPTLPRELKNVMEASWNHDPKQRPSAVQIADYLVCHSLKKRYPPSHVIFRTMAFRENIVKQRRKNKSKNKSVQSGRSSRTKKKAKQNSQEVKKNKPKDGAETKKPSKKRSTNDSNS